MFIFPQVEISTTEQDLLAEVFANPVVQKYLHHLAYQDGIELSTGDPKEGESAESFLRRRAAVKGRLEVYNTLLSIPRLNAKS